MAMCGLSTSALFPRTGIFNHSSTRERNHVRNLKAGSACKTRCTGKSACLLPETTFALSILTATAQALRDRPKTRSLVLGNLALAYLRQRQLDAATATLHDAIDVLETSRGGGAMTVVFGAARELYPWRAEPAVHDVHDRLLALVARA